MLFVCDVSRSVCIICLLFIAVFVVSGGGCLCVLLWVVFGGGSFLFVFCIWVWLYVLCLSACM